MIHNSLSYINFCLVLQACLEENDRKKVQNFLVIIFLLYSILLSLKEFFARRMDGFL